MNPVESLPKHPDELSLAGTWSFELDPDNKGIEQRWFGRELAGKIQLPGGLSEQGFGEPVEVATAWMGQIVNRSWFDAPHYAPYRQAGNIKVPFWLQPELSYSGAAWYQCDLQIPETWSERRIVLSLERPHWKTRVWLDERELGTNESLSTTHAYELGTGLAPASHRLTVLVDNSLVVDIGINSHSITDHTQGNWNGIVGRLVLRATARSWIEDLQAYPCVSKKTFSLRGCIGFEASVPVGTLVTLSVRLEKSPTEPPAIQTLVLADGTFSAEYPLGDDARTWDEFNPELYLVTARLPGGEGKSLRVGLREISTEGTQFLLNGHKACFRGTLDCAAFPETGHPPTDVAAWRRLIGVVKAHGLNLIRFHSWCPPEAAFEAADELGMYFQIEAASWPNQSTTLGDGKPVDAWIDAETTRILRTYGNHPCFVLMAAGNEPGGTKHSDYLGTWLLKYQAADPRRLFTGGAGWPEIVENQFHLTPDPRIQRWGEELKSRINALPPETCSDYRSFVAARQVPVISHEIGQWCAYPDFDEILRYTGYLKPRNLEIFRDFLEAHQLGARARAFLMASGKLQVLCYKEEIESALRTRGMGGFQLLGLQDFPGQGTALVGVLNAFWESKGYVSAAEFHRFCSATVPLARLPRRVFTTDERLEADVEVAHFGAAALRDVVANWRLLDAGDRVVTEGRFAARDIPVDNGTPLGRVSADLSKVQAPARCRLVVSLGQGGVENDWDIWVYPARMDLRVPAGVLVSHAWDTQTKSALEAGGSVLLVLRPEQLRESAQGPVALGFSSIFWNTAWTRGQAPHTLGILCDPKHPALEAFPTEAYSQWQWWYLIQGAGTLVLNSLPPGLEPVVQVIDDWFTARRLGLVIEARVGHGRLLVTSIDLLREDNPVTRQLRASLLSYMAGKRFAPVVELSHEQVGGLLADRG